MTKGKNYRSEDKTNFQTQKAVGHIYANTEIKNRPESMEAVEIYEEVDIACTQNTAESFKQITEESPRQKSTDSQPPMSVAIVRSIRCLQVMCVALLVAVIIMAATLGSVMSDQKARLEATEESSDLLKSEMEHKRYDLQQLQSQITQMASDIKVLTTVFQQMNDTIKLDKAENYATLQSYNIRITDNYATNRNQSISITQLKAGQNSVSETLQSQNSTIMAIEALYNKSSGSLTNHTMTGFTARGKPSQSNKVLIYPEMLSQVGGGFDTSTGVFTCPVAGLYLVSMTLQVQTDGLINCWLYKNGSKIQLEIHINGEGEESASQTAVFYLRQGDSLYIGDCDESNIGDETTFTVVLLQADT